MTWKYILHQWLYYCGWTNLFALIRFAGWDNIDTAMDPGGVSLYESLVIANLGAFSVGLLTGLFEVRKNTILKVRWLWRHINLIRIVVFFFIIVISSLFSCLVMIAIEEMWTTHQILPRFIEIIMSSAFRIVMLFLVIVSIINVALLSFMDWHGTATFSSIITGHIYLTNKEERVFLFVDLNSSTEISTKIGFQKYSELLESCFDELRILSQKYEAEIYQYVGDEIILSWPKKKALKNNQCFKVFLHFKSILQDKATSFHDRFNATPTFKAALSQGIVLSSIAGLHEKHKAYYGQPLHRAARMLEKCKNYRLDFLCTQELKDDTQQGDIHFKFIASTRLRGEQETSHLFSIESNEISLIA